MATPETDLRFSAAGVENPNRCYIGACRRQSLHGSNSVISTMNIPPSRDLKTNKTLQMSKRCNRNCASIADKAATSSNSLSISCVFHIFSYLNSFKKKHAAFRCDFILSFLSLKGIKKNYFPFFFVYFLILQSSFLLSCAAPDPTEPIIRSDATNHKNFSVFTGSNGLPASATSLGLQFQILTFLEEWEDTRNILLIGGLDYIYMLDPTAKAINKSLPYMERLQWTADQYYVGSCLQFRPEEECNNFIKIVQKFNNDTLFVCGTNAYTPRCRYYTRNDFRSPNNRNSLYYYEDSCKRSCDVPYTPEATSVLLYTNTTQGYRRIHAVNGQFHGRDSKLLKTGAFPVIFSEENWFNEPVFIKIIEYQNKAYLFFREMAAGVEAGSSTTTYGRVAQVCLNDTGGERLLRDEWTSFLKARLKCSLPSSNTGQEELTFNNLTSVSDIVNITMGDQKIEAVFATFTTPQSWNPVSLSAVCVFTMKSIQHLFETGELLDERRLHSSTESFMSGTVETYIKVPVQEQAIPRPRPGTCMKPGEMRQASVLYFIRNHFIMYGPILAFQKSPLFVSDLNIKMTQVAVDSKAGNSDRLIVYVGTDDGRILRLRPKFDGNSPSKTRGKQSIFLEEMRVMKKSDCETKSCAVRALHVYRPTEDNERPYLFVAFNQKLVRTPLSICDRYKKDICCNFDPECGWKSGKCVERINGNCSLPEIADSGELPDSCYNEIGGAVKMKDKDGESTPYLASFNPFGAGVIGAAIAVFLTLFIVFLIHKRRQKKKTKPDASLPIISEGQQENLLKSNCFDIETTETTLLKSDSLVTANKDGKRKKGNFYSPTKPRLMKEKNKSSEQTSELKEISETEKIALNTTSNLVSPTSDELTKSSISRDSFSNRLDEEITPPDLPPKLRSVKKDSLTASSPVDNSFNLNNSNNTTGCASEFSTLELPQPKYLQDGDDSETGSLLSNPPPFKPPPPKINIRKHDTFSEPRPHSVKPPILPKSAAVLRSASLKAFEKRPVVPSRNSTKTEEDLLSSRTVPEGLRSSGGNFFNSKKASSPAPRNSSFTANDRSPIKGGIPVLPPLSPNK